MNRQCRKYRKLRTGIFLLTGLLKNNFTPNAYIIITFLTTGIKFDFPQ
jgi:hypothetical protein